MTLRNLSSPRSPRMFSPRAAAIAALVLVSGVSFALGFLVGKVGRTGPPSVTVTEVPASPVVEDTAPAYGEHVPEPVVSALPEAEPPKSQKAEFAKNKQAEPAVGGQAPKSAGGQAPYSVQVGAFKARKDAEVLKKKLAGKGYEPYIVKEGDVHRVRVGRFGQRKEAEALAIGIKKATGLEAFVTTEKAPVTPEKVSMTPGY